jgi:hypothetical protein
MTLKRSAGVSRSSASSSPALAWPIDVPPIEPEVSITKMTSRGKRFASCPAVGGVSMAKT